jgi:glycosyltransferase involved in cell wall biosynthesis
VPFADLPLLYSLADVFAYPSTYEGFGLPVLEAMRCGCPVVTSNVTSIPEIAGDAAIFVNPLEIDDIAEAVKTVANSESRRNDLIQKGLTHVQPFTWENCANKTLKVYEGLLG